MSACRGGNPGKGAVKLLLDLAIAGRLASFFDNKIKVRARKRLMLPEVLPHQTLPTVAHDRTAHFAADGDAEAGRSVSSSPLPNNDEMPSVQTRDRSAQLEKISPLAEPLFLGQAPIHRVLIWRRWKRTYACALLHADA